MNQTAGCGPLFPNWLLSEGDEAVLAAPEGNFAAELALMHLQPRFQALPPQEKQTYAGQSASAELADLRKALKQAGASKEETERIVREHERQRAQLTTAIDEQGLWRKAHVYAGQPLSESADDSPPPALPPMAVVQGLPGEFADYFEGFIAWHKPQQAGAQDARAAWERLLARPQAERRYKSTWAAFMLGKSWEEEEPEKAVAYFKQVRELTRAGFRDSLGLAAASFGWEARVRLQQTNYTAALELYLEQMATGDPTATNSLLDVASRALAAGPEQLVALARNPRTQKVMTAYVISRGKWDSIYGTRPWDQEEKPAPTASLASRWLRAAEAAGSQDMDSAEALALMAYRVNDMEGAQRWIRHAPNTPVTQWLQAKLLLRAGKLDSAAALLARLSPLFPITHETTNAPAPAERKDALKAQGDSAERRVHGELGVLRLARGDYAQALDLLLNAGYWMDAAYIAERVLTLEELRSYVDRFWPPASAAQEAEEKDRFGESEVCPARLREQIRYLLARQLTRELHGDQARAYYPAEWVGAFDQLAAHLRAGWDESQPPAERAGALFQAALITRTNGMELLGTEVAPDWHYHLGGFEAGVDGDARNGTKAVVIQPLPDELRRNAEHVPDPDERFHYRYQAAELAWEAARLLPDNNDQTAYILWQGGCFLKNRDPNSADRFYKALVRRNRKTALGAEADRQRWFPALDENGNIVPKPPRAKKQEPPPEAPAMSEPGSQNESVPPEASPAPPADSEEAKGYEYTIRAGDSLASIAHKFAQAGVAVTVQDLLQANPGLDGSRLLIGQTIFVPFNGH